MAKYTEGICADGAGILKDGELITIEQILKELNEAQAGSEAVSAELACSVADLAKAKIILDAILQACHENMTGTVSNYYLNSRLGNVRILLGD